MKSADHGLPVSRAKAGYSPGPHPTRAVSAPSGSAQKRDYYNPPAGEAVNRQCDRLGTAPAQGCKGRGRCEACGEASGLRYGHRVDTAKEATGLSLCIGGKERVGELCLKETTSLIETCIGNRARAQMVPMAKASFRGGRRGGGYAFALRVSLMTGLAPSKVTMDTSRNSILFATRFALLAATEFWIETIWSLVSAPSWQQLSSLVRYLSIAINPSKTALIFVSSRRPRSAADSMEDIRGGIRWRTTFCSVLSLSSVSWFPFKTSFACANSTKSPFVITFLRSDISRSYCSRANRALARSVKITPPKPKTPIRAGNMKSCKISYQVHDGGDVPKIAEKNSAKSIAEVSHESFV